MIYLDIETGRYPGVDVSDIDRPPASPDELIGREPASYKSEAAQLRWREAEVGKRAASYAEAVRSRIAGTSLEPLLGGWVLCVALAVDDGEPWVIYSDTEQDEQRTLQRLDEGLAKYPRHELAAYNGVSFDFPFLAKRALRHGLPRLAARMYVRNRWRHPGHVDPYQAWQGADMRAKGRLTEVAAFLGYDVTDEVRGSDVWDLYAQGEHDAIRNHALEDVRMLRHVTEELRAAGWI